uniref:TOM1-like protein 6 n=1 Tax=Erigeron canadensis TaxID=72917 RepID=UPI001CB8D6FD|nr:TOM1-like protein 6 [Erigeron canadensis]
MVCDEDILCQGIQFNDAVQYVIEKHDAIASGSPLPVEPPNLMTSRSNGKQIDTTEVKLKSTSVASSPTPSSSTNEIQEDQESSTPVASRHKETQTVATQYDKKPVSDPSLSMALVPSDPLPPPSKKASEEDLIDLLSLALTPSIPNETPPAPMAAETLPQAQQMNTYVVPWAQNQPQLEYESQQSVQSTQQGTYIPPPWAPTPGYYCNPYASNYSSPSYYNNSSVAGSSLNPYIPSYRLFEDLNVLGNLRTNGTPGTSGPGMLGARK